MICIPITARSIENTISEMISASKHADIVELRIDYIPELQNAEACIEESLKRKTKRNNYKQAWKGRWQI